MGNDVRKDEETGRGAPYVSVILPVHNESGHLSVEIERIRTALEESEYSFEIIAVNDGSTDGSAEELTAIPGLRCIHLKENHGAGFARRMGTQAAEGEVVVWTDCDMTYPNHEIPRLVKEMEGYDQVVGARTTEAGTSRALRQSAKWLIRKLASYLLQVRIPDLNSGFRAFRKDVARQFLHLVPTGFSCVTTMTMTFLANGYSVKHIPIEYLPRAGKSKFHWRKDTQRYATQVIRMILSYEPLRIFMPLGLLLTGVGIGKLIFDWVGKDFHLATNTLLIFFASFQILVIGLLADLVVRQSRVGDRVESASLYLTKIDP